MSNLKTRPDLLVSARQLIASNERLRALFQEACDEQWLADNLSVRLGAMHSTENFADVKDVSLYLAHEFFANKSNPIVVADRSTGSAVVHLPVDAIWQPGPVPRESGGLAEPMPRLRPDIEAALIQTHHDRAREHREIIHRSEAGYLARDMKILSSVGRNDLIECAVKGAMKSFGNALAKHLYGAVVLGDGMQPMTLTASASMRIPDLRSLNLHFRFERWLTHVMTTGWVQSVANAIVEKATAEPSLSKWVGMETDTVLWIGDLDRIRYAIDRVPNSVAFLHGEGLVGVMGSVLSVKANLEVTTTSRVHNDTWYVKVDLPVHVTWLSDKIASFAMDVHREHRAEVIR